MLSCVRLCSPPDIFAHLLAPWKKKKKHSLLLARLLVFLVGRSVGGLLPRVH